MSDEQRLQALIDRYLDETLTVSEADELNRYLAESPAAQERFWSSVRIHARLRQWGEQSFGQLREGGELSEPAARPSGVAPAWAIPLVAAAALVCVGLLGFWVLAPANDPVQAVATLSSFDQVRWVGIEEPREGDPVRAGQRIEIAAGKISIDFLTGAAVLLEGPAIFEVESVNAAFLVLGRLTATAATPESRGFAVRTRTARAVDLGTVFTAEAAPDGDSRFGVISGEVEVHRPGATAPELLRAGDLLTVGAGRPRIAVRAEAGDETPAFRFPSIEPPSDQDYADSRQGHTQVTIARGKLAIHTRNPAASSGPPAVLLDGRGQSGPDVPIESVFFPNDQPGCLLLDLGRAVTVTKINTYSWHQNGANPDNRMRAVQKYTLYGFAGDVAPPVDSDAEAVGWERVARVDTDEYFGVVSRQDRPAQQACSITAASGPLGRYRYLLWELQPNRLPGIRPLHNSFYGEIDIYADP